MDMNEPPIEEVPDEVLIEQEKVRERLFIHDPTVDVNDARVNWLICELALANAKIKILSDEVRELK